MSCFYTYPGLTRKRSDNFASGLLAQTRNYRLKAIGSPYGWVVWAVIAANASILMRSSQVNWLIFQPLYFEVRLELFHYIRNPICCVN